MSGQINTGHIPDSYADDWRFARLLLPRSSNCAADPSHYNDVILSVMASQVTSLTIVYSGVYSGADQIKPQSFASLAFARGEFPAHRANKVEMFPFDDVVMCGENHHHQWKHLVCMNEEVPGLKWFV